MSIRKLLLLTAVNTCLAGTIMTTASAQQLSAQKTQIILDEQKPLKPLYALVITTREPMIPVSLATSVLPSAVFLVNQADVLTKAIRNLMAERKKLQAELEYLRDILDIEGVEY